jgi:hypothetical protein
MCHDGARMAVVLTTILLSGITSGQEVHCGSHAKITKIPIVTASGPNGSLNLKDEEKIALAFVVSVASIEAWCVQDEEHPCTLRQMISSNRTAAGSAVGCLLYDPADDANYNISVTINDKSWEARASAKNKSLMSFHFKSTGEPHSPNTFYKPPGVVGPVEKELTAHEASGNSLQSL